MSLEFLAELRDHGRIRARLNGRRFVDGGSLKAFHRTEADPWRGRIREIERRGLAGVEYGRLARVALDRRNEGVHGGRDRLVGGDEIDAHCASCQRTLRRAVR